MTKEELGKLINRNKFRVNLLDGMPFGAADEYLDDNMEKIRKILKLCEQYETEN